MTAVQETALAGSPASIGAVATYLRTGLEAAVSGLADDVSARRSAASSAWSGAAADAFSTRLTQVVSAATSLSGVTGTFSTAVETVSSELAAVLAALGHARDTARAGGLVVAGTVIHHPGAAPHTPAALDPGATPTQVRAHEQAQAAVSAYQGAVSAWTTAVELARDAYDRWNRALDAFAATWNGNGGNIVTAVEGLGWTAVDTSVASTVFKLGSVTMLNENWLASAQKSLAAAVDANGKLTVGASRYYELVDQLPKNEAAIVDAGAVASKLEVAGRAGGLVLGGVATGFAIYDDIQHGEAPTQAVVSNVAGFGASVVAGLAVGAAVGSVVPVGGTIVGAVVGGIVGAGVGMFTSGMVDHLFEDTHAGFSDTLTAGVDEITSTGAAIGDLAKDAWDAIF